MSVPRSLAPIEELSQGASPVCRDAPAHHGGIEGWVGFRLHLLHELLHPLLL